MRMMRHVEAGKEALRPQIRVQREQQLAHERGRLKVGQDVLHEVSWVCVTRVGIRVGICHPLLNRGIIVDHDLVHREDGQGAGNTADICCPLLSCHATEGVSE